MLTNNTDEEQNTTGTIKIVDTFLKYLFGAAFLFCVPITLNIYIDYSTLNPRSYAAILLLFILSTILIALAILFYGSPIFFHILKYKSITRSDLSVIVTEQTKPTKRSFKIRRILLWSCFISAIITLIANITYMIILIIIT